jgi:4-carboxymuconolactone decarboxylase
MTDEARESRLEAGLRIRREMLGDEHVDRSMDASPFTREYQEFATELAWGTIWTRDGLEPKIRSLVNVAMLTALNRPNAIALHVKSALHNGATPEEIAEVLLQVAVYAGVVAAGDGFRVADPIVSAELAKSAGAATSAEAGAKPAGRA